jgi:hypothetical protein
VDQIVQVAAAMITERKRWMTYTYFNRNPGWSPGTTHLFSSVKKDIPLMQRVTFSTMVVDLKDPEFGEHWSESARRKIHRAQNEKLAVDRGGNLLPEILKLFNPSVKLKGLRGYEPSHFDYIPVIECSSVSYEGVMLCSHIWYIDEEEKRALLYVNASNHRNENDDKSLTGRAHYFLLWQDGLYLRHLGMETMDLMGYEPDTADPGLKGVYQWKEGTLGKQETLYHYYPSWFFLLRKFRNMVTG